MLAANFGTTTVGRHRPRIVAVIGGLQEQLANLARLAREAQADILEFRADFESGNFEPSTAIDDIKREAPSLPILLTIRPSTDGGEFHGSETERLRLFSTLVACVQAVDVELYATEINKKVVDAARSHNVPVVASVHDFKRTPDKADLAKFVTDAKALGANILKIAVMAKSQKDLRALQDFTESNDDILVSTTSMGDEGTVSRVLNPLLGSCLTYGYVGEFPTTPGQIHVTRLRQLFKKFANDRLELSQAHLLSMLAELPMDAAAHT